MMELRKVAKTKSSPPSPRMLRFCDDPWPAATARAEGGGRGGRRQEGAWHSCFLLALSPSVISNEAVMSYLALEAPGWLKFHAVQAPNDHSGLHLSVEPLRKSACAHVYVCVCECAGM